MYTILQIVQLLSIKGKSREGSKEKAYQKLKQGFKQREIDVNICRQVFLDVSGVAEEEWAPASAGS